MSKPIEPNPITKPIEPNNPITKQPNNLIIEPSDCEIGKLTDCEIGKLSDYEIGKILGHGKFGDVFLGKKKSTNQAIALKVIGKSRIKKSGLVHQVDAEIEILKLVDHPHIVKFVKSFEDSNRIYIVMEYMEGGELFKKLKNYIQDNRGLEESLVAKYILQLTEAIEYLHGLNIIHRDIKPENILLSTDHNHIKLCDFGWSVISSEPQTTSCGTLDYLCPEIVTGKRYDHTCDWWGMGVLTYELLVGNPPFMAPTHRETYKNIETINLTYPEYLSEEAINFMNALIVKTPFMRMTSNEIKDHPWIIKY